MPIHSTLSNELKKKRNTKEKNINKRKQGGRKTRDKSLKGKGEKQNEQRGPVSVYGLATIMQLVGIVAWLSDKSIEWRVIRNGIVRDTFTDSTLYVREGNDDRTGCKTMGSCRTKTHTISCDSFDVINILIEIVEN